MAPPKEATVGADGTITWPGVRRIVGDSERVAIEFAKQLAETSGRRLIGVTVGEALTAAPPASSAGLACGLDEAIIVRVPVAPGTADAAAGMAAAIAELEGVRLVVLGSGASDSGTRLFGPYLGGLLGWPVLTGVLDAAFDGDAVRVVSEAAGSPRRFRIDGPAVLCVGAASRTPRQMGLRDIMAAGRKPSRTVTPEEVAAMTIGAHRVLSRSELETGTRRGLVIAGSDPDEAAAALIAELTAKGAL